VNTANEDFDDISGDDSQPVEPDSDVESRNDQQERKSAHRPHLRNIMLICINAVTSLSRPQPVHSASPELRDGGVRVELGQNEYMPPEPVCMDEDDSD